MEDGRQPMKHLPSQPTASRETMQPSPRRQIAAILSRLALIYWRPDFTQEQARLVIENYLSDLEGYTPAEVDAACAKYRQLPTSEYFPKPGQLLAILNPAPKYPDIPPRRLPTFRSAPQLTGPKPKLRSVAEILRDSGHVSAAEKWEARQ